MTYSIKKQKQLLESERDSDFAPPSSYLSNSNKKSDSTHMDAKIPHPPATASVLISDQPQATYPPQQETVNRSDAGNIYSHLGTGVNQPQSGSGVSLHQASSDASWPQPCSSVNLPQPGASLIQPQPGIFPMGAPPPFPPPHMHNFAYPSTQPMFYPPNLPPPPFIYPSHYPPPPAPPGVGP